MKRITAVILLASLSALSNVQGQVTPANLTLTKTDSADPVSVNTPLVYTVTVANAASGSTAVSNVVVTDTLPAGMTFVSATATSGTVSNSGQVVTFRVDLLNTGASASVAITVTPTQSGYFTNSVTLAAEPSGSLADPITEVTRVLSDLRLSKTDSVDPVMPGESLVYTIVASNAGPSTVTNVVVADTVPSVFSILSALSSAGTVTTVSNTVTVTSSTLATAQVIQVVITVRAAGGVGTITNTATVTGIADGSNTLSESAVQATTIAGNIRGDMDGDGFGDIVLQERDTGAPFISFMTGTTEVASSYLFGEPIDVRPWRLVAAIDLDGNGADDLVFRYASEHQFAVGFMEDGEVVDIKYITLDGETDLDPWHIVAGGDCDGDGFGELILQDGDSGVYAVAFMNGAEMLGSEFLFGEETDVAPWQIEGAGDLDGDGRAEIVARYGGDHVYAVGFLAEDGFTVETSTYLLGAQTDIDPWHLVAVSDLFGDGICDLIFQQDDAEIFAVATMNGVYVTGGDTLGTDAESEPSVVIGPK